VREITIAIDGPAASGKSTTARAVADRLGYCHLNSGLLYRAITWAGLEGGWLDDRERFGRELAGLDLRLVRDPPVYRVHVGGRAVGAALSSPRTSSRVSAVAADPAVRARVLEILREQAGKGGLVCDGRDIGTVVFPDAELKIYLLAASTERARRRLLEWGAEPTEDRVREEAARLSARDEADSARAIAPLRRAEDAIELDTTSLTPIEAVDRIVALALRARTKLG
jgi:cytidylate kinase